MDIDAEHWLQAAHRVPSPNCNERPAGTVIDLLVIHSISLPAGQFDGHCVEQLFTNCLDCQAHPSFGDLDGVCVSAHLFIRRDGSLIQFVPFHLRAWHAGASHFAGRDNCNDFSIGIELEGTEQSAYTQAQYRQLAAVVKTLKQSYPAIDDSRMVGHSDIAPGRKSDPGPLFDWAYLRQMLGAS